MALRPTGVPPNDPDGLMIALVRSFIEVTAETDSEAALAALGLRLFARSRGLADVHGPLAYIKARPS
jgi:hypothetical protein